MNVRLLAISHSCLEEVNRGVYRYLASHYPITMHLVIPRFNDVGDGYKECAPVSEPFETTLLDPLGRHLRLRRFKGLTKLIEESKPTHILVEADPSTLLVNEVLWATRGTQTKVWCLTAENLPRNYVKEGFLQIGKPKNALGQWMTWAFLKAAQNKLDRVFTLSQDGTKAMESLGFHHRATQIPLGFDPVLFHPQPPEKIKATRARLGLTDPTIAYFGRLTEEKGIHLLVKAASRIKDLRWQFLIDSFSHHRTPYIQNLEKLISDLGLKERVVFFESNHREMADYMNAADIAVLPSLSTPKWKEQYGRVIPEAMACGKLVIGSSSGAIPELISTHGLIFPEGDEEALATKLRLALTSEESWLREIRHRAARHALENLSLIRQAAIWAEHLQVLPSTKRAALG